MAAVSEFSLMYVTTEVCGSDCATGNSGAVEESRIFILIAFQFVIGNAPRFQRDLYISRRARPAILKTSAARALYESRRSTEKYF